MTERDGWMLRKRGTWAAGALLLTTLALGVAFAATSWANYRSARAAYQTLNRGQVEILENALRLAMQTTGFGNEQAALELLVSERSEAGLRYVALTTADGTVEMEAGERSGTITIPASFFQRAQRTGIVMVPVEDRIRAFLPRRPQIFRRPQGAGDDDQPGRSGANRGGGGGGDRFGGGGGGFGVGNGGFGHTVLEFEPLAAIGLMTQARRSMMLGSMVAGLLTFAAILFWRQSSRYEAGRIAFEQQRRLSQLGEMSAVLAHEIRNPLASLKGNAQLLAERLTAGSTEKAKADRVVAEATRLENLTGDLLEFARSGPIELNSVDPVEIGRAAILEVAPDGIDLDDTGAPSQWPLDAGRMRYALVNILQNAVQASPDRHPVLRVGRDGGDGLLFEVRDFGPGIPEGAEEQLFEPFFTTRTKGTGLGLAVAQRAAELHGGTIIARNHPEGGAIFSIVIPGKSSFTGT